MKFSDKIFASTLLIAALAGLGVTWACRESAKRQTKASYLSKYSVLADTLGHALNQLEWKSESLLYSAGKVSKLELEPGMVIVMLDDHTNIHQVWQERFLSLGVAIRASGYCTSRHQRIFALGLKPTPHCWTSPSSCWTTSYLAIKKPGCTWQRTLGS